MIEKNQILENNKEFISTHSFFMDVTVVSGSYNLICAATVPLLCQLLHLCVVNMWVSVHTFHNSAMVATHRHHMAIAI